MQLTSLPLPLPKMLLVRYKLSVATTFNRSSTALQVNWTSPNRPPTHPAVPLLFLSTVKMLAPSLTLLILQIYLHWNLLPSIGSHLIFPDFQIQSDSRCSHLAFKYAENLDFSSFLPHQLCRSVASASWSLLSCSLVESVKRMWFDWVSSSVLRRRLCRVYFKVCYYWLPLVVSGCYYALFY